MKRISIPDSIKDDPDDAIKRVKVVPVGDTRAFLASLGLGRMFPQAVDAPTQPVVAKYWDGYKYSPVRRVHILHKICDQVYHGCERVLLYHIIHRGLDADKMMPFAQSMQALRAVVHIHAPNSHFDEYRRMADNPTAHIEEFNGYEYTYRPTHSRELAFKLKDVMMSIQDIFDGKLTIDRKCKPLPIRELEMFHGPTSEFLRDPQPMDVDVCRTMLAFLEQNYLDETIDTTIIPLSRPRDYDAATWTFGKHRGQSIHLTKDDSYIEWCLNTIKRGEFSAKMPSNRVLECMTYRYFENTGEKICVVDDVDDAVKTEMIKLE